MSQLVIRVVLAYPSHVRLSSSCDSKGRREIGAFRSGICDVPEPLLKDLANAGSGFDTLTTLHMVHTVPAHWGRLPEAFGGGAGMAAPAGGVRNPVPGGAVTARPRWGVCLRWLDGSGWTAAQMPPG